MLDLITLFALIAAIHLAPALTPPTWPVIVMYVLRQHVPIWAIVLTGAAAAASGRLTLALSTRALAHRLPVKMRNNLLSAHALLERRRGSRGMIHLLFFLGSGSAPLFEAAALARLRLVPLTATYFLGRIPRYAFYALVAQQLPRTGLWEQFKHDLLQPGAIAIEILLLVGLLGLVGTDWSKWLKRR